MRRVLLIVTLCLFGFIGTWGLVKKRRKTEETAAAVAKAQKVEMNASEGADLEPKEPEPSLVMLGSTGQEDKLAMHQVDKIGTLFARGPHKSPIVKTVKYLSKVPWIKGRPAWIADYASHYKTSRHFIARSLNQKVDYETQKVRRGDYFNVLAPDKDINFIVVLDVSRSKGWFFYHDLDSGEKVCLKTYDVGLGRLDPQQASGSLTPLGVFRLGDKVAAYKPGSMGLFQDQEIELISVFGTRWIPFDEEVSGLEISAKGYGLHGVPWKISDEGEGVYKECPDLIGKYDSDGCVRFTQKDIEELYAVVISKPTYVEIVKDCKDSTLFDFNKITLD